MVKFYVRPLELSYGSDAKRFVKLKLAKKLCGRNDISFSKLEIIKRDKAVKKKIIYIQDLKQIELKNKNNIKNLIKNLISKRKPYLGINLNSPRLFGILNITPDSFSDGGLYFKKTLAVKHAKKLLKDGADIIDIGGESTRPGAKLISVNEEKKRILNIIKNLKKFRISADTRKSEVMIDSIKNGAKIINDVSGLDYDKKSINVILRFKPNIILNHSKGNPQTMQKNPKYKNVLLDIYDYLENKINLLVNHGFKRDKIIVDPGIGFGKNLEHNLKLMSHIGIFHALGCPIMLGSSRKSFIAKVMKNRVTKNRIGGTIASVLTGANQGVQFFRVHDIASVKEALNINQSLINI
ncbi:MAG: dihydropteroate synthase [Candidatus Pelagibacter sp.]|nr:dihydropteroate synthase [Candidatus Pelagibacter sp.]OUV98623.1 MAG: dihydropteroate synthase [Candidatus Pelagibacter sp. TMED142]